MKKNYVMLCMAAALPFAASTVFAQNQAAAQPAVEDAYTLKVPTSPASQVSGTGYELKGTTISGAISAPSQPILTTPVGATAPFKTESGVYLYPSISTGMGYNDNIQSSPTNPVKSSVVSVAPQLVAEFKHKGDRYTALASANALNYASSSGDNTTNSEFKIAGDNYFTARARAAWSLGQVRNTDPRGSTDRAVQSEPDRWTSNNLDGRFIYGAPEAPGRIELDLGNRNKSFDNNRATAGVGDNNTASYAARLYYRVGTRTQALGEYRNTKADYGSSLSTESNTEQRYYVGLTWEASAATTGVVKFGRMNKDFSAVGREGYNGDSWEASIRWMPLTYSTFDAQTSRLTADSTGFGNYIVNTGSNLNWNHKWTQSLSSRTTFGLLKSDYAGTTRSDSITSYGLGLDYSMSRWLRLGMDWSGTDNSSNVSTFTYKRNLTMFTLNASL